MLGFDLDVNSGTLVAEVLSRSFAFFDGTTDIREAPSGVPREFALYQNYPNPFNPATTIAFSLPVAETVRLSVYSLLGQDVATLVAGESLEAGLHQISWDGSRSDGQPASSGVYLYRIKAGGWVETRRMVLLR